VALAPPPPARPAPCREGDVPGCTAACDPGVMASCHALGVAYFKGQGVEVDQARALPLFEKACDAAVLAACRDLGEVLLLGAA
jgi:TPR repeat protein